MIRLDVIKLEIEQVFVQNFFYVKSNVNKDVNENISFLKIAPTDFLDYENSTKKIVLDENEQNLLLNSKLLELQIHNDNYSVSNQRTASVSQILPSYIKYLSILNNKLNYKTKLGYLVLSNSRIIVPVYTDKNRVQDVYLKNNKEFTIIDDSTIELKFCFYIYLKPIAFNLDTNDIYNNNYHINLNMNNVLKDNTTYDLHLYELIYPINFKINQIIYIKNVYTNEIVSINIILDIKNNYLTLKNL